MAAGRACWTNCGSTRAAAIIPSTPSSFTGPSATTSRFNARLAEVVQAMERPLRVSQDDLFAATPSSSSTSKSTTATSCRSIAAVRARTGRTAPASSARETAIDRNAHETLASGEKLLALAERIGQREAYRAGRNQRRLAQLHPLRRAHLGRLLLDRPAGERVHQGPVEDQVAIRRRCRPSRRRRSWTGDTAPWPRWSRTDGPALVVFNPTSWPRTDVRAR